MPYKIILNTVFTSLKIDYRYDKFVEIIRVKFIPKIGVYREAELIWKKMKRLILDFPIKKIWCTTKKLSSVNVNLFCLVELYAYLEMYIHHLGNVLHFFQTLETVFLRLEKFKNKWFLFICNTKFYLNKWKENSLSDSSLLQYNIFTNWLMIFVDLYENVIFLLFGI